MFAQMSPFFPTQHHDDRHFTVIASVQYGVHRDEYRAGVHNHAFTSKLREHRAVAQQQQATERHVEWCASTKKRRILRSACRLCIAQRRNTHPLQPVRVPDPVLRNPQRKGAADDEQCILMDCSIDVFMLPGLLVKMLVVHGRIGEDRGTNVLGQIHRNGVPRSIVPVRFGYGEAT